MHSFHRFRLSVTIPFIAVIVILGWFLTGNMSVQAQSIPTAAITLDGRQLFQVTATEQFSAENRVADANFILRETVRSEAPVKVKIVEINQLPVIQVNGRHLLTVTQKDTPAGRTKQEQAEIWAKRITEAIQQGQEERSSSYFWRAILLSLLAFLSAIAIHKLLGWVWNYWLRRLFPRSAHNPDTGAQPIAMELFLQLTLVVVRSLLWIGILIFITDLFPLTRYWSQRITNLLWMSLTSPVITLGESSYSVINILILIGLFFAVLVIAGALTNLLRSRILRITSVSRGVQESIAIVINYSLIFIGTVVLLQIWGLDISSLAIIASVLGVAIGFGLQGVAKEFVSGFVVTFERAIEVGDFIEVGEYMGTVERLNGRSTHIRTLDDILVIVPNSRFLEKEVVNWSHHSPASRLVLPVRVAYGASINTIRSALLEAADEIADVLKKPKPQVWFQGYGEDFLKFQLLIWISRPRKQFQIKSDLYFKIEDCLRKQNIHIPFPQRSLHLHSGSLPLELSPKLEVALSQLSEGLMALLKIQLQSGSSNGGMNQSSSIDNEQGIGNKE